MQVLKGVTFSNEKTKMVTEEHVISLPTPQQQARKYYRDSADTEERRLSRKMRDSTLKEEIKRRQRSDTIALRNAVQMDVIKQQIKELKRQ